MATYPGMSTSSWTSDGLNFEDVGYNSYSLSNFSFNDGVKLDAFETWKTDMYLRDMPEYSTWPDFGVEDYPFAVSSPTTECMGLNEAVQSTNPHPSMATPRRRDSKPKRKMQFDTEAVKTSLKSWSTVDSKPLPSDEVPTTDAIRAERKRLRLDVDLTAIKNDDEYRMERRKEKNRVTAERSRQRKKIKAQILEVENENLKNENQKLIDLASLLLTQMDVHPTKSGLQEILSNLS